MGFMVGKLVLERPKACQQVVRRVRGLNGKFRDAG
jgi:hypothetical protein